jgi:hypothetical protein
VKPRTSFFSQTPTARELAALGLHRSGREWRGNCPSCGCSNTFMLTERRGRVLGWCASCQHQDFVSARLRKPACANEGANEHNACAL